MERHRAAAQLLGRLYRNNAMPHRREASRIPTCARTDINDAAGSIRNQITDEPMGVPERDAFVAFEQVRSLVRIVFGAADPNRLHPIPSAHSVSRGRS